MNLSLNEIYLHLGIQDSHLNANKLIQHHQPDLNELVVAEIDFEGKSFVLHQSTASAWKKMKEAAHQDGITLNPFSGFRSYLYQMRMIERHLKNGRSLEDTLTEIAIPGFSEHHTGRAIDLHEKGKTRLEQDFDQTPDFDWLTKNAHKFKFKMSYPKDNSLGIIYEPWHWYYSENESVISY